jgi:uncharacterized membrane protein
MVQSPDATETADPALFRAVLTPHRSLSPRGFLVLMAAVSLVSFVTGLVFYAIGAWPVMGFFGLDVAIIYFAFRLNYRAGRAHELVELTRDHLRITHVDPNGRRNTFTCNPYWARVDVRTGPDGRSDLAILAQGQVHRFGHVLNHEERRDFAEALRVALFESKGGVRI